MSLETSEGLLEAMGTQALADGSYRTSAEISKDIDNVSLTDVANVRHSVQSALSFLHYCVTTTFPLLGET